MNKAPNISSPPDEWRNYVLSINLEEILGLWKLNQSKFPHVKLEGFLDGQSVSISKNEIEKYTTLNKSFRLTNIQLFVPELKTFSELYFKQNNRALTANLYFTPHASAQCFNFHSDPQFSFVYQLLGEKSWTFLKDENGFVKELYEQDHILNSYKKGALSIFEHDLHLQTGQWLEVPHSLIHKAQNKHNSPSAHITFSYNVPVIGDLMKYMAELILGKPIKDNYLEVVQLSDLKKSLLKFNGNYSELMEGLKLKHLEFEHYKKSHGRPY